LSTGVAAVQKQLARDDLQRIIESCPLLARVNAVIEGYVDLGSTSAMWRPG
jgi:hypothetical protein